MSESKKVNIEKLAEIIALSVRDLTKEELEKLSGILKDEYGLEPTVQVVEVAADTVEEKTSFTATLVEVGNKKLKLVSTLKGIKGVSLKEAKDLIEATPMIIKADIDMAEAEMIKSDFESLSEGAKVEIS